MRWFYPVRQRDILAYLKGMEGRIMAQIDDLNAKLAAMDAKVTAETDRDASVIALLVELKGMVDGITQAPDLASAIAQAQAISDHLDANDATLAAAVAANTPAPPAPGP